MQDQSIIDAFRTLNLSPGATLKEVRQAYRTLVRAWHPDRYSNDPQLQQTAQERLKEINAAYNLARKNIGSARTEIDSPFRFDLVPKPAAPTTVSPAGERAAGGTAGKRQSQASPPPIKRPVLLNAIFLFILLPGAIFMWRRHGMSPPGISQFLLVVTIPGLCAFLCNSPFRTRELQRGYLAAIVLAAGVLVGDAVTLHRNDSRLSVTGPDDSVPPPYADSPTWRDGGSFESGFTLGPAERPGARGVRSPAAPVSPGAPSVPAPAPPQPPQAPLRR